MYPHPLLRQILPTALTRRQTPLPRRALFLPERADGFEPEHDFLVQNWRPDLIAETREDDKGFKVDLP